MSDFDTRMKRLRHDLRTAILIEHTTIPAYATALFSLMDHREFGPSNAEPAEVLRSVVAEEMLHLTLAANVLNAVRGTPRLTDPDWIPRYPATLPHSHGMPMISLRPFSREQIRVFRTVERPTPPGGRPKDDGYGSIGEFYDAVLDELNALCRDYDAKRIFSGDPARQVGPDAYYGGGGTIIPVTDFESAKHAITLIKDEGEGVHGAHRIFDGDRIPGTRREAFAHFFCFNEVYNCRYYSDDDHPRTAPSGKNLIVDWDAVWPMKENPKAADYVDRPEIHAKMIAFNRVYSDLLKTLDRTFDGEPDRLQDTIPVMYQLKYRGTELMRIPIGDDGLSAGPSWEFLPSEEDRAADAP